MCRARLCGMFSLGVLCGQSVLVRASPRCDRTAHPYNASVCATCTFKPPVVEQLGWNATKLETHFSVPVWAILLSLLPEGLLEPCAEARKR